LGARGAGSVGRQWPRARTATELLIRSGSRQHALAAGSSWYRRLTCNRALAGAQEKVGGDQVVLSTVCMVSIQRADDDRRPLGVWQQAVWHALCHALAARVLVFVFP